MAGYVNAGITTVGGWIPIRCLKYNAIISNASKKLTALQNNIVNLYYGIDIEKPISINKICKKLGIKLIEVPYTVKLNDIENYLDRGYTKFKMLRVKQTPIPTGY